MVSGKISVSFPSLPEPWAGMGITGLLLCQLPVNAITPGSHTAQPQKLIQQKAVKNYPDKISMNGSIPLFIQRAFPAGLPGQTRGPHPGGRGSSEHVALEDVGWWWPGQCWGSPRGWEGFSSPEHPVALCAALCPSLSQTGGAGWAAGGAGAEHPQLAKGRCQGSSVPREGRGTGRAS